MIAALYQGRRATAAEAGRGARARCPWTGQEVVAQVGPVRQHWAYIGGAPKLGDGYEADTAFHEHWKSLVPTQGVEVIIGQSGAERHVVDIMTDGAFIELQQRPITKGEIERRMASMTTVDPDRKRVMILDVEPIWRDQLTLGPYDHEHPNRYPLSLTPKRQWIDDLLALPALEVYADYNTEADKLLRIWTFKGDKFAAFKARSAFVQDHFR